MTGCMFASLSVRQYFRKMSMSKVHAKFLTFATLSYRTRRVSQVLHVILLMLQSTEVGKSHSQPNTPNSAHCVI